MKIRHTMRTRNEDYGLMRGSLGGRKERKEKEIGVRKRMKAGKGETVLRFSYDI